MGVVYEAEQLSIKRSVALKVLPFAAVVDPRALQRFKNEVTAVATLEHPHSVSVYAIGEERGIHYYAMRLIRGQSLAAVIRELQQRSQNQDSVTRESLSQVVAAMPQPDESSSHAGTGTMPYASEVEDPVETVARGRSVTQTSRITDVSYFRNVAGLMIQASEALHHAHQQGIVHRDIKPGNILLDAHGNLFVTDFGLARIENEAYDKAGQHGKAAELLEQLVETSKDKLGEDHHDTLLRMNRLAKAYQNNGQHDKAAALFEQVNK